MINSFSSHLLQDTKGVDIASRAVTGSYSPAGADGLAKDLVASEVAAMPGDVGRDSLLPLGFTSTTSEREKERV